MTTATLTLGKQLSEMKASALSDKSYLKRNAIALAKEKGLYKEIIKARVSGLLSTVQEGLNKVISGESSLKLVGDQIIIASTIEGSFQFILLHTGEDISITSMLENIAREHDVDLSGQIEYIKGWMEDNQISVSVRLVYTKNHWSDPYNEFLVKTL